MQSKTFKRFYKQAGIAEVEGGFAVRLDGRPIKTPAGRALVVPSAALAEAIAAEWNEQGETVRPATMPMMQLAATAIDRVEPERPAILEQLRKYAATDLVCYHADFPPDLAERQRAGWQPLLDWVAAELGARLVVTESILAVEQPQEALAALAARLEGHDTWRLAALQLTCAATGSLVLAVALTEGRLDAEATFQLSQLDETYQREKWGDDEEAAERRAALERDVASAARLLALL